MDSRLEDVQDAEGQQDHRATRYIPCKQCGQFPNPQGGELGLTEAHTGVGAAQRGGLKGEGGLKRHSCKLCSFSSRYANHVKRHMKTHNGEKPYCCPLCAYASAQLVNLQRHVRVHTGEKPYKCPLCMFACSSLGNLKRHQRMHMASMRSHSQGQPVAGHQTRGGAPGLQADAIKHMAVRRSSEADYGGTTPDKERKNLLEASGTEEGVQEGGCGLPTVHFPLTCNVCGRDLEGSSRTHTCGRCTLDALSKELPGAADDKLYPCPTCPFVTHYPNHLSRHMKTHTGERPYKCPDCSYASAHFDNLKRHHRVHTGERPYKCPECDYACGNLANLRRHQRIHTGLKPFSCDMCSYSCNQSMNLKRHMLRHTGEKPFRCRECPYSTGHWDNYKRHQRKHGHAADGWVKVRLPDDEDEEEE